jgi:hypothetical protein
MCFAGKPSCGATVLLKTQPAIRLRRIAHDIIARNYTTGDCTVVCLLDADFFAAGFALAAVFFVAAFLVCGLAAEAALAVAALVAVFFVLMFLPLLFGSKAAIILF